MARYQAFRSVCLGTLVLLALVTTCTARLSSLELIDEQSKLVRSSSTASSAARTHGRTRHGVNPVVADSKVKTGHNTKTSDGDSDDNGISGSASLNGQVVHTSGAAAAASSSGGGAALMSAKLAQDENVIKGNILAQLFGADERRILVAKHIYQLKESDIALQDLTTQALQKGAKTLTSVGLAVSGSPVDKLWKALVFLSDQKNVVKSLHAMATSGSAAEPSPQSLLQPAIQATAESLGKEKAKSGSMAMPHISLDVVYTVVKQDSPALKQLKSESAVTDQERAIAKDIQTVTQGTLEAEEAWKKVSPWATIGFVSAYIGSAIATAFTAGAAAPAVVATAAAHTAHSATGAALHLAAENRLKNEAKLMLTHLYLLEATHTGLISSTDVSPRKCDITSNEGNQGCPSTHWCQFHFVTLPQPQKLDGSGYCMPRFWWHRQGIDELCTDHSDCASAFCYFEWLHSKFDSETPTNMVRGVCKKALKRAGSAAQDPASRTPVAMPTKKDDISQGSDFPYSFTVDKPVLHTSGKRREKTDRTSSGPSLGLFG